MTKPESRRGKAFEELVDRRRYELYSETTLKKLFACLGINGPRYLAMRPIRRQNALTDHR